MNKPHLSHESEIPLHTGQGGNLQQYLSKRNILVGLTATAAVATGIALLPQGEQAVQAAHDVVTGTKTYQLTDADTAALNNAARTGNSTGAGQFDMIIKYPN